MLDRRPLHVLLAALKPISDRDSNIPAAWIKTLLLVALDEGKGVAHYSRTAKVHRTIMSRYLHCIGDKKRRDDKPGLGLVEVKIDPARADRRQVFLTEEGRAIVAAIIAQFWSPRKIS
jgi:DNA-binding MarR family transcriptional regulator